MKKSASFTTRKWYKDKKLDLFIDFLKVEPNSLFISAFFGLIAAFLGILTSLFIQKLVDYYIPNKMWDEMQETILFLCFFLSIRVLLGNLRAKLLAFFQESFSKKVTNHFFGKVLKLPPSLFAHRDTGEVVSRLNDINRIQRGVSALLGNLSIDLVMFMVTLTYLYILSEKIALITLSIFVICLAISLFVNRLLEQKGKKVMQSYAKSESLFISVINGIREIRSNKKQSIFHQKGTQLYDYYQLDNLNLTKFQILLSLVIGIIALLGQMTSIYLGIDLVRDSTLSSGQLIAIITLILAIQMPMTKLAMINTYLAQIKVAYNRVYEMVNTNFNQEEGTKVDFKIKQIDLIEISLAYPGAPGILEGCSISFKPNTLTTLIGPSGVGKSTLLNLIKKEIDPVEGKTIINTTKDLTKVNYDSWISKLGIVNQSPILFEGSLLENIAMDFDLTIDQKTQIVNLMQKTGLHQFFMALPMNYLTPIENKGDNLSGGQKQLLALARALFKKPEVLILDEPSSALDSETENFIVSLLNNLKKSMIIIVVSHRSAVLEISDQVIDLSKKAKPVNA
jgi:ATP-binding cassette subfamily B protein